jgi:hypothetical protein
MDCVQPIDYTVAIVGVAFMVMVVGVCWAIAWSDK